MLGGALCVCLLLECDMCAGITHGEDAEQQTGRDNGCRADPDDGARRVAGSEGAGCEGGGGDAEVAGRLVEAERESAPARACKVDLHHHGH